MRITYTEWTKQFILQQENLREEKKLDELSKTKDIGFSYMYGNYGTKDPTIIIKLLKYCDYTALNILKEIPEFKKKVEKFITKNFDKIRATKWYMLGAP